MMTPVRRGEQRSHQKDQIRLLPSKIEVFRLRSQNKEHQNITPAENAKKGTTRTTRTLLMYKSY
jgi:hypothetical protein